MAWWPKIYEGVQTSLFRINDNSDIYILKSWAATTCQQESIQDIDCRMAIHPQAPPRRNRKTPIQAIAQTMCPPTRRWTSTRTRTRTTRTRTWKNGQRMDGEKWTLADNFGNVPTYPICSCNWNPMLQCRIIYNPHLTILICQEWQSYKGDKQEWSWSFRRSPQKRKSL